MKKYIPYLIIAILTGCLIISMQTCNNKNKTIAGTIALNNKLLHDTCKYYVTKNGEIVSTNKSLTVTVQSLQDENDDLTKELSNMKIKASNVVYIDRTIDHTTIHDSIHHDTIKSNKPVVFSDTNNKWFHIKGIAALNYTNLTSVKVFDTCYTVQMTNGKVGIAHKNPYIISTNLLAIDVARPTPLFRKFWVDFGLGVIAATVTLHYLK